ETKLWRNPEAHRTVLAQILDYARHLTNMNYSDFKAKVEAIATRDGRPKDLLKIVSAKSPKPEFDSVAFEEGLRRSLATGNFLLLTVGDRIRPDVVMLSEIMGATPNLEFTLRLVEIAFYRLDKKNDWPVVAVPSIVGQTREVTRAVVKIRYEQKQPEVEVSAVGEQSDNRRGRIDIEAFLKSLPKGLDEIFRPYLESWIEGPLVVSWGSVGFSLRYSRGNKLLTIIEGYPTMIAIFVERQLVDWGNPIDAYGAYYSHIERIPEVQRVHSLNRKYVYYNKLTQDETRIILETTDQLAQALVKWSASSQ
ncbi:hypothetical protein HY772_09295, partial [Candidatus Woesearchaeota archaeon]|nr:hypothetical protein [Candidatus Woesearchaeota archaeon]